VSRTPRVLSCGFGGPRKVVLHGHRRASLRCPMPGIELWQPPNAGPNIEFSEKEGQPNSFPQVTVDLRNAPLMSTMPFQRLTVHKLITCFGKILCAALLIVKRSRYFWMHDGSFASHPKGTLGRGYARMVGSFRADEISP